MIETLLDRAAVNLESTYLAIGSATPGHRIEQNSEFVSCVCELPHAVGNFAIARRLTPESASRLARIAGSKPAYNVYSPRRSPHESGSVLLQAAGFRKVYSLVQMSACGRESDDPVDLEEARNPQERHSVASFMTLQFFSRQRRDVRETIAGATAGSGLHLYRILHEGASVGAVMICRTPNLLGIYNLCIASSLRGKGFGRQAMGVLQNSAYREGRELALQCDRSLVQWYSSLGFNDAGSVDVYTLAAKAKPDIMS